jgi:hypothetical protein
MSFVKADMNRIPYTNHGLHLNKIGKQLVHYQLVYFLDSTFEQKRSQPIVLGSHRILDDHNLICDGKQVLEIQEVNDVIFGNQMFETQVVNNITSDSNQRHNVQDLKTACNSNQIHKLQHDNDLTCDSNQIQTSSRNLSHNRRFPYASADK